MWLLKIDEYTGYVDNHDVSNDGWKGVKTFRRLVEKYGLPGLTCVSLYADYLSPFRNYVDSERWLKCLDEVYGNMDELDFGDPLIVESIKLYGEMQYNSDMERNMMNEAISKRLNERLRDAYDKNNEADIDKINKQLKSHTDNIKEFKKMFNLDELIRDHGVAENGYELSRIELDLLTRRHSKFKNGGEKLKNPNKLGISEN